MANGVEASHRIAEVALGALKAIGLAATPKNMEIWCAHIGGTNPSLSRAIQKLQGTGDRIVQADLDTLYQENIQRADLSRGVADLVTRFRDEISTLQDVIETTGEDAHGNNQTLTDLAEQIKNTDDDAPAVRTLLESALTITTAMREQNTTLENRLAESSAEVASLQRNVENIRAEAIRDPLTGVANRREFDNALKASLENAEQSGNEVALVMADIDFFKSFNDQFGHQTGDQVLRLVAEVMDANIKGHDLLARYGGEEFAMILPETSLDGAEMLANRIREAVEARRLKKRRTNEDLGVITMSMGVASYAAGDTPDTMIERADECLYAAKAAGRNCVIKEDDRDPQTDLQSSTSAA